MIGAGISGNKVPDLQKRLEKDVLAKKPTLVVIYIGINDVWHGEKDPARGTPKDKYEAGLKEIIGKIKDAGARVVLCTPTVIGEKKAGANKLDAKLDEYAEVSRKVAKETGAQLCDLRKAFQEHLAKNNPEDKEKGVLTTDRVHLNDAGNKLVADTILATIDRMTAFESAARRAFFPFHSLLPAWAFFVRPWAVSGDITDDRNSAHTPGRPRGAIMSEETPFDDLVARLRCGDPDAAAELVRRYEPAIRAAVRGRMADTRLRRLFDSMDVCQTVLASFFARVALGQYELNSADDLVKLLVGMARNKLAKQVTRHRRAGRDYRRTAPAADGHAQPVSRDPGPGPPGGRGRTGRRGLPAALPGRAAAGRAAAAGPRLAGHRRRPGRVGGGAAQAARPGGRPGGRPTGRLSGRCPPPRPTRRAPSRP